MPEHSVSDFVLDPRLVRRSFDKAAPHYDDTAVLQHEVGRRMLERLELIRMQPERIVDIGTGTGRCSTLLARRYKHAHVIGIDIAFSMLSCARRKQPWQPWRSSPRYVCGDANFLPFRVASIDMLFSNLVVQWCNDLDHILCQMKQVLRPGGVLMFTTFGPDTLKELRQSWQEVDEYSHVNAFLDMHDVGDALIRAGFNAPVLDVEQIVITYPHVLKLMGDLKALGAHNVTAGRRHGLTGKGRIRSVEETYEKFRRDGRLPATYEVIYGHAWQSPEAGPDTLPTRAQSEVSVADIVKHHRHKHHRHKHHRHKHHRHKHHRQIQDS